MIHRASKISSLQKVHESTPMFQTLFQKRGYVDSASQFFFLSFFFFFCLTLKIFTQLKIFRRARKFVGETLLSSKVARARESGQIFAGTRLCVSHKTFGSFTDTVIIVLVKFEGDLRISCPFCRGDKTIFKFRYNCARISFLLSYIV